MGFYWKHLIITEGQGTQQPDFFIDVPGYWSRHKIDGMWLPANGYASYRLILHGLSHPYPVTVFIPDFGSAYRVFIDGMLAAESGRVSNDISGIHTVPKAKLYPVTLSDSEVHEVVIEVATTRFSGLYKAPVLKDYNQAIREDTIRNGIRFILFGTVVFSFFILAVIYMLSIRKNRHAIWLPAMSLLIMLRIMLTTEFYGFWQDIAFFSLSYETTNELMFVPGLPAYGEARHYRLLGNHPWHHGLVHRLLLHQRKHLPQYVPGHAHPALVVPDDPEPRFRLAHRGGIPGSGRFLFPAGDGQEPDRHPEGVL